MPGTGSAKTGRRPPMKPRYKAFAYCLLSLSAVVSYAQTSHPAGSPKAAFSISAVVMRDVIMPPAETLLQITLTNLSDKDVYLGGPVNGSPPLWTSFEIDVHDAHGNPVPETVAGREIRRWPSNVNGPVFPVKAGEKISLEVMLSRVFDVSHPGTYTVQVRLKDRSSGAMVQSNAVSFAILQQTKPGKSVPPGFSIMVSAPLNSVRSGWLIPVSIAIKNTSPQKLTLAMWDGRNQNWTTHAPDEFGSGIEVRRADGESTPLTKEGLDYVEHGGIPKGAFTFGSIQPGQVLEQMRAAGLLFNVSQPGRYILDVVLTDPTTGIPVKSNAITVNVVDSAASPSDVMPPQTPFIISLGTESAYLPKSNYPLSICRTNISDHEIVLDNLTFMDELSVLDRQGSPVPLSEASKNPQSYAAGMRQRSVDGVGSRTYRMQPGEPLCGILPIDEIFDLSKPGTYSVEVIQHDYPDRAPGQNMPTVRSNRVQVEVAH